MYVYGLEIEFESPKVDMYVSDFGSGFLGLGARIRRAKVEVEVAVVGLEGLEEQ